MTCSDHLQGNADHTGCCTVLCNLFLLNYSTIGPPLGMPLSGSISACIWPREGRPGFKTTLAFRLRIQVQEEQPCIYMIQGHGLLRSGSHMHACRASWVAHYLSDSEGTRCAELVGRDVRSKLYIDFRPHVCLTTICDKQFDRLARQWL